STRICGSSTASTWRRPSVSPATGSAESAWSGPASGSASSIGSRTSTTRHRSGELTDGRRESGADGARTRGLPAASRTLSQLSYGPKLPAKCSGELEIFSPTDAPALIVPRRSQPQLDDALIANRFEWDEVTRIQLQAVRSNCVDFVCRVATANKPLGRSPTRVRPDAYNVAMARGPLALHSNECRP